MKNFFSELAGQGTSVLGRKFAVGPADGVPSRECQWRRDPHPDPPPGGREGAGRVSVRSAQDTTPPPGAPHQPRSPSGPLGQ